MVKKKKAFKKYEEVLTLDDLQSMRDSAKGLEKKKIQTQIDLLFNPPKPKKKKKQKREKRYRED